MARKAKYEVPPIARKFVREPNLVLDGFEIAQERLSRSVVSLVQNLSFSI